MDILQEGIDIIDPRVSFTDIDQLNYAGLDLDKPEYVCFIPPKILSTLLMTSAGLKVADISCLYCAHQRGECPISALSYKGRRSLASEFHFKLNQEREQGKNGIRFQVLLIF